ncbi:MAG: methyltransferase [Candidatus Dojkabacteria bacterium]
MTSFTLKYIQGTQELVLEELQTRFPHCDVLAIHAASIEFTSPTHDIEAYRVLLSPLHLKREDNAQINLARRSWRSSFTSGGINPSLAYCMCMLAKIKETDVVLDPFCGSGTIPVSAALYFTPHKAIASDVSGMAVDATQKSFTEAGVSMKRFVVFRSNVSMLRLPKAYVNIVITNLPFGVKVKDHEANQKIYTQFAHKMKSLVKPGGTIIALTQEKTLLQECFTGDEFKLIQKLQVHQGGLIPEIFVYRRI